MILNFHYPLGETCMIQIKEIKPCPYCGVVPTDMEDFIFPVNRDRTVWRAGCTDGGETDAFGWITGCGFEIERSSPQEAIASWNEL